MEHAQEFSKFSHTHTKREDELVNVKRNNMEKFICINFKWN